MVVSEDDCPNRSALSSDLQPYQDSTRHCGIGILWHMHIGCMCCSFGDGKVVSVAEDTLTHQEVLFLD